MNKKKTRTVYPYSMVLDVVNNLGPVTVADVSENLNMRRIEAQRWLNKARNENYAFVIPTERDQKLSSMFELQMTEVRNTKLYNNKRV
jgi:hypothetical protein